jgi:predicted aspartyl protease
MVRSTWGRPVGAAFALAALTIGAARAQTAPAPSSPPPAANSPAQPAAAPDAPPNPEKLALAEDSVARMTIPVMIDGQGPFPFVIDTGADRTVISEAPVLAAHDLGAMGLLGIDSLSGQHVVMDFPAHQFLSEPSRPEPQTADTIVVRGRSRFGQLILVDAQVRGIKVFVILDSGAESTVGNLALEKLLLRGRAGEDVKLTQVISVTGRHTPAKYEEVGEMHIGGLTIRNLPLAFAELHTFARFGLADRPAMLLGMDVMSTCRRVTVDFKRREASFTLNRE